jgi:hypothetical protein
MVPLIKRSTDSLVAVIGEKAAAEVTFDAIEYVCMRSNYKMYKWYSHCYCIKFCITYRNKFYRVYSCFTLEAIVATAFGRQINLQQGESDEFTKAMGTAMKGFASGQFENFTLIHSML